MTTLQDKLVRIAGAYDHARAKHPVFADDLTPVPGPIAARDLERLHRLNASRPFFALNLLAEEVAEIADAWTHGQGEDALREVYDAIAVLLRTADMIEERTTGRAGGAR